MFVNSIIFCYVLCCVFACYCIHVYAVVSSLSLLLLLWTDVNTDYSKQAKKARIQQQLLWIAKKQRILQSLEEVCPSTMSAYDLIQ